MWIGTDSEVAINALEVGGECIAFVRDYAAAAAKDSENWNFADSFRFPHDYVALAARIKEVSA